MGEHADRKLVSHLLKGDQRTFDTYFASNYPRLYRFALARLDNDHDLVDKLTPGLVQHEERVDNDPIVTACYAARAS